MILTAGLIVGLERGKPRASGDDPSVSELINEGAL